MGPFIVMQYIFQVPPSWLSPTIHISLPHDISFEIFSFILPHTSHHNQILMIAINENVKKNNGLGVLKHTHRPQRKQETNTILVGIPYH